MTTTRTVDEPAEGRKRRTVLIGVGNEYRDDDGAGLVAARKLGRMDLPGVTVYESPAEPASLIELWRDADHVVLIDAVQAGGRVGQVYRIEAHREPLPVGLFSGSTHGLGVAHAVELGRALGALPGELVLYGVEGSDFAPGLGLSPGVQRAVNEVVERVCAEVERWSSSEPRTMEVHHA